MKKYLREIEVSGLILTFIGLIFVMICTQFGVTSGANFAVWACGFGLLLLFSVVIYKACHWKEYERDNKQYIVIILITIVILFIQMLIKR